MDTPVVEDDARKCRVMSSDVASVTGAKEFDITREEGMFGESMSSSSSPIEDDEDDDDESSDPKAPQQSSSAIVARSEIRHGM
jgi:hypothetical protein